MHKGVINKDLLYKYLQILGTGYATGNFESLYPYLADDCVWESQWRLTPETGKESVINYFNKKGAILRESGSFPKWMVVEYVDNLNPVDASIVKGKSKSEPMRVALWYQSGMLALFMAQELDDATNASIVEIELDEKDLIRRIDICMPEFYKFKKYEPDIKF